MASSMLSSWQLAVSGSTLSSSASRYTTLAISTGLYAQAMVDIGNSTWWWQWTASHNKIFKLDITVNTVTSPSTTLPGTSS